WGDADSAYAWQKKFGQTPASLRLVSSSQPAGARRQSARGHAGLLDRFGPRATSGDIEGGGALCHSASRPHRPVSLSTSRWTQFFLRRALIGGEHKRKCERPNEQERESNTRGCCFHGSHLEVLYGFPRSIMR